MRTFVLVAACIVSLALGAASALSHHSAAMFDPEKLVTVSGTVKEFEYIDPHSWLYVDVRADNGEDTLWGFEADGPNALMRAGIKPDSLKPGDQVTVEARPLRDGRPAGAWIRLTKSDGTVLTPPPGERPTSAPTN